MFDDTGYSRGKYLTRNNTFALLWTDTQFFTKQLFIPHRETRKQQMVTQEKQKRKTPICVKFIPMLNLITDNYSVD